MLSMNPSCTKENYPYNVPNLNNIYRKNDTYLSPPYGNDAIINFVTGTFEDLKTLTYHNKILQADVSKKALDIDCRCIIDISGDYFILDSPIDETYQIIRFMDGGLSYFVQIPNDFNIQFKILPNTEFFSIRILILTKNLQFSFLKKQDKQDFIRTELKTFPEIDTMMYGYKPKLLLLENDNCIAIFKNKIILIKSDESLNPKVFFSLKDLQYIPNNFYINTEISFITNQGDIGIII